MDRKATIATLESRRFWLAVLGVAEAINQAAGWHLSSGVFAAIESMIGLLAAGDTVVSASHVSVATPVAVSTGLATTNTQQTMGSVQGKAN